MTDQPVIIFASDTGWGVSDGESVRQISSAPGASAAQIATEISTMIGSSSANITLALPTSWCLSATVSLKGVPARNRRTSLLYRLELLLPTTAENIAADYILNEPETALGICVSTATVKGFVDAIEAEGIFIDRIVPASVYAVSALTAQQVCDVVVWQSGVSPSPGMPREGRGEGDFNFRNDSFHRNNPLPSPFPADRERGPQGISSSVELFTLHHQKITGWYKFPAEIEDLSWHLQQLWVHQAMPQNLIACNLAPELLDFLKTNRSVNILEVNDRLIEDAVVAAASAGEPQPVNLRQDGLAPRSAFAAVRRPIKETSFAAILLVVAICGAACWRATRLEQVALNNRNQQRDLFLEVFPGHTVPANIVSRLRSEERALGPGISDSATMSKQSAMAVLQSILAGIETLPPEVRFQVDDLRIDDAKFSLGGTVRNRNDLTSFVDALQQTSQLQLDPPQTEQAAGKGLHITLNGSKPDGLKRK